jgi:hypothetical protein
MSMSRDAKRAYTRARDGSIRAVDRTYTGVRHRPERPFYPPSQEAAMPSFTRFIPPAPPAVIRRLLLVGAVAAALVVGSAPAAATVIEREHYSGSFELTEDDCGFTLNHVQTFYGQAHLRVDTTGQAFLGVDAFHFREVVTNPDTGQWFVIRAHGQFHEIRATQVEGTVYEFVLLEAGQQFVIEDAEGNVIVRDRGALFHTYLFDTLGDGQPGGEFIEDTGFVAHGPHPSFDQDFCAIAAELTGVTD